MYSLGEKTEFTSADLKPETVYIIESKGLEIIVREQTLKESAIEEIKEQPFF